jgi:D-inositol-3-phosphate glycosyltransferase
MRIALVSPGRGSQPAGLSDTSTDRITSLAQALAGLGHRVTVYARSDSSSLPNSSILCRGASVEYVTAGPRAPLDATEPTAHLPEFADCLARRWRRNPPDVIDAHFWTSGLAALAGARGLRTPVVLTFISLAAAELRHGLCPEGGRDARLRLERAVARSADLLLASSSQEQADLARLGAPRTRIRVVPCGIDTGRFTPEGPEAKRGTRRRLLAAQPLDAAGDLSVALRALAEIPDAELVITGGSSQAQQRGDAARRTILQQGAKLGVADRLVFTGPVSAAKLPALLRSADLLVSTAVYEPVGLTAIQAMACGTPVVACAAGAEQDAVIDMTTGVHLPPGQPDKLALLVRRLLASPVRLEAYGVAAADRARSRYCQDRIAGETVAAYETLLARAAAPANPEQAEDDAAVAAPQRERAGAPA